LIAGTQKIQEIEMKTKNLLLASSALALLASVGEAQARNLYISVFGGANWLQDSSGSLDTDFGGEGTNDTFVFNSDADTGFVLGGAVGTHLDKWVKGLSGEVEVSFRRNDVGGGWSAVVDGGEGFGGYTTSDAIHANESTFTIMANLWYEIDAGWKVRPYVGGGVGWGRAQADGVFLSSSGDSTLFTFDVENSGFAYQLGAGFNYDVSPGVVVGVGYRYLNGPNLDFPDDYFYDSGPFKLDNDNHSALVNLTIDID
jgi:OmpA-OmpF porin, OOP family